MKKLIALITFFAILPAYADQVKTAAEAGRTFIVRSIIDDHDYLSCYFNNKSEPCRIQHMGGMLSSFFSLDALKTSAPIPRQITEKILARLKNERKGSAEAYYWSDPIEAEADADTTAFGMRSLFLLGEDVHIGGLKQFYISRENAYATFVNPNARPTTTVLAANNNDIHAEVNANVFNLLHELHLDSKINYALIKQFQSEEGYWHSFFYRGKYYSTYLNMAVLCETHKLPEVVSKGKHFILTSQNKDGSWGSPGDAYDTSLALNTLIACEDTKSAAIKRGISYLVNTQNKSGYWENNEMIWELTLSDRPSIKCAVYDTNHIVTTALAVKALAKYNATKDTRKKLPGI